MFLTLEENQYLQERPQSQQKELKFKESGLINRRKHQNKCNLYPQSPDKYSESGEVVIKIKLVFLEIKSAVIKILQCYRQAK